MRYKLRYYWRILCHTLGFCPRCGEHINRLPHGGVICPTCKQR